MTPETVYRTLLQMILTLQRGLGVVGGPTGIIAGSYGDSSHYVVVTVNDQGRITAIDTRPLSGSGGSPAPEVTSWIPLASGAEPMTFISDGNGNPILVSYSA